MAIVYKLYKPKRILNRHKHPDHWFWMRYTAHPYMGCQHGCEYCYWRESKYCPYPDPEDFSFPQGNYGPPHSYGGDCFAPCGRSQ